MAALVTLADVKNSIPESDGLEDDYLNLVINAQDEYIVDRFGAHEGEVVVRLETDQNRFLWLGRKAESIQSISEGYSNLSSFQLVTASSYFLHNDGKVIERYHNRWAPYVQVTYTPRDDKDTRRLITLKLIELELVHKPARSQSIGDLSITYDIYQKVRNEITRVLN